jgi:predicted ATPase
MHLESLAIENFRAISKLSMTFGSSANVLVGPNAVGKTTLLEAIRFNKALLAPRTSQETQAIMVHLGISSNQLPQILNFDAIAGDPTKKIIVNCIYKLSEEDLRILPELTQQLTRSVAAAQVGIIGTGQNSQNQMIQFFGTPAGRQALESSVAFVQENIGTMARAGTCELKLLIEPRTGQIQGESLFGQVVFAGLEARNSPYKTSFSYFSADRAMTTGDAQIQLGSVDAQQQLESHNSNPGLKFQRFKSTLFSSFVESEESRLQQDENFKKIFKDLLKEKELSNFSVNKFGQASIGVRDLRTGRVFDIDSLSSGEKGLILTFLIMSKAIERGGLVLIDEPEIHLNPAVCKDLLNFMLKRYLEPLNIQAIICTHSPEILTSAMREEKCTVHHIRAGGAVSIIRKQDQPEVAEALKLLGTSEVEEMLYDAVVFVEGADDVELLEAAFPAMLSRVKFRELFGRGEIENQIQKLQEAERNDLKENISYFLFDRDRKISELQSTPKVVVKQWDRYCLENYLIEPEILFDLLRKEFRSSKTPTNLGEATQRFTEIAMRQLQEVVIEEVYTNLAYDSPGIRRADKKSKTFEEAGTALFGRITKVRMELAPLDETQWKQKFVKTCDEMLAQRQQEWSTAWISKCSGKQFLNDVYADCGITVRPLVLKRRLLQENKYANEGKGTESWKLMSATFADLFK